MKPYCKVLPSLFIGQVISL